MCSITEMPAARTARAKAGSMAAPVASPPACRTRARECAASSPRASSPVLIKGNPEAHQIANAGRALGTEHVHGGRMAQAAARAQSVGDVLGDTVVGEHRGGNTALGEASVAVFQPGLGDQGNLRAGAGSYCRDEPSDTAADDDDEFMRTRAVVSISVRICPGCGASIRSSATRAGMATSSRTVMRLSTCPAVKCLEHPGDVAGMDAVHGRTGADDGVEAEDSVLRILVRESVHEVDLGADREGASVGAAAIAL